MTTDKPAVFTDEEFQRFAEAWAGGDDANALMRQFGIGPGQWWRVTNAARRNHNKEYWRVVCESRRDFISTMKFESLAEKASHGTIRTRRTKNGTVTIQKPNPRAVNRLLRYMNYHGMTS